MPGMDAPSATSGRRTPANILLVDDEEPVRRLLATVLSGLDEPCHIQAAAEARQAQALLSTAAFDVVITDVNMPGLSGLDLMQWAQEQRPGPTWIILTGQGGYEDAVRAVRLGAFDFVAKTTDMLDRISVAVRNALRQRYLASERLWLQEELEQRNARLREQVACLREQTDIIEQDLRQAELIQRALLPRQPPRLEGYAVDAVYRPCHIVGGDLYDVVQEDAGHVSLVVADATGHGIAAAMLAVLFKHDLHLLDASTGRPKAPSEVLREANRALLDECRAPAFFVTAAYCLLDLQTGEITTASAGHPPLLIGRSDGRVEPVHRTGPALGLFEDASFGEARFRLEDGDRLLLYTDGLSGRANGRRLLSLDELSEAVRDHSLPGASLLNRLLELGAQHRGGEPSEDDITLLCLSRDRRVSTLDNGLPADAPAPRRVPHPGQADVLKGEQDGHMVVSIQGDANWTFCRSFHDACAHERQAGRAVTLDLSMCTHLDSTFLGTVQELVSLADRERIAFTIQGILPDVRRLFEELGMTAVLQHASGPMQPVPARMTRLELFGADQVADRWRVVLAHEALALLNERNHKEFEDLIEAVRRELRQQAA